MIISHRHRYVFIQMPHTASTAIALELERHYDGQHILWKHAHLGDFLRVATAAEKDYFIFLTLRNPLDEAVSIYWKIKTDHDQRLSRAARGVSRRDLALHRFVVETGSDFRAYFLRAYRPLVPFDKASRLHVERLHYMIRFETLEQDFAAVLARLGIDQVRPLPVINPTAGRHGQFDAEYTPGIVPRARQVFGPYMRAIGYDLPEAWGQHVPAWSMALFRLQSPFRRFYWRHLKWRGRKVAAVAPTEKPAAVQANDDKSR